MSTLSDKILSYSPEQHIRFNEAYTTSPTNLGSGGTGTWSTSNEVPVLNPAGGPDGQGSWTLNTGYLNNVLDSSTTQFRILSSSNEVVNPELMDNDYSIGFWFKTNGTMQEENDHSTFATTPMAANGNKAGYAVYMFGFSAGNSNKGKLTFFSTASSTSSANFTTPERYDDQQWHYIAWRSTYDPATDLVTLIIYIDGVLIKTSTYTLAGDIGYGQVAFGQASTATPSEDFPSYEISNLYIAPYSTITETEIAEIWTVGNAPAPGINVLVSDIAFETTSALFEDPSVTSEAIFNSSPMIANGNMTTPTVVAVIGDSTYITTTIFVDAVFAPNVVVIGSQNSNNVAESMLASAELTNNIVIQSGTDDIFSAEEFVASVILVEPFRPVSFMEAQAIMTQPLVEIETNYSALITSSNPYLYIGDGNASPSNLGYQSGTFNLVGIDAQTPPQDQLGLVNEGLCWSYDQTGEYIEFTPPTTQDSWGSISGQTFDWSAEMWVRTQTTDEKIIFDGEGANAQNSPLIRLTINQDASVEASIRRNDISSANVTSAANAFLSGLWNHIVVTCENNGDGTATSRLWVNGSVRQTYSFTYTAYTNTETQQISFGDRVRSTAGNDGFVAIDEMAIYTSTLNNSEIIQRYNFVINLSPDVSYQASPMTASTQSGNHLFIARTNINYPANAATSSSEIVQAIAVPEINNSFSANVMTSSSIAVDPVFVGTPDYKKLMQPYTVYAEMGSAAVLNNQYSQYVLDNLSPYRYVSFDTTDTLADSGSDTHYSVGLVRFDGTVVNPDLAINNKSAQTSGLSYTTSGVWLMESEYNDDWGTGVNEYHSSFWIQRSLSDASTSGLRVIWNLNGAFDNQHVIMYQWQSKLWLQFNNGSGTHLEQFVEGYDLFDYERHHVVIDFDHTGINNFVRLYIDASMVMEVDLGQYTGQTINSDVFLEPNLESSNYPRLSVGSLITPFGFTALPVVPANYSAIIDEIHWSKQPIDDLGVVTLFAAMPPKLNNIVAADTLTTTGIMVEPVISTGTGSSANAMTSESLMQDVDVSTVISVMLYPDPFRVSGYFRGGFASQTAFILPDVMVVSSELIGPFFEYSLTAEPMVVSDSRFSSSIVNGVPTKAEYSPWVKHLRATDATRLLTPLGAK